MLFKKFSLESLIGEIHKILLSTAKEKGIELVFQYDHEVPKVVIGDRMSIYRILINLLGNAVKFTEQGFVKLSVNLVRKAERNVFLEFIAEDSGPGIREDKINFIFEKFGKGTLSHAGKHKGIGLGLRVVKQWMHELEGEIDIISKETVGTKFICHLPFKLPLLETEL